MSTSDMTMQEMAESLTGFEEIAIEHHFDRDVSDLLENKATTAMRALIFVEKIRGGATPVEAKKAVMELRLGEAMEWYATDNDDFDPDNPDSASGKGESSPSDEPTS